MYNRCQQANAAKAAQKYNTMAEFFNTHMANVFPFMDGVPEDPILSADVSDKVLEEFFKLYDSVSVEQRESIMKTKRYQESWKGVKVFLSKMDKVRDFFDKYFAPTEKDGPPGLSVEVQFRQNKMRETHGDKVMDWALILGDTAVSEKEGKQPVRWELGKNTSFGFQWALNAPIRPVENSGPQALAYVAGRAIFVYQGYWSLLRAMMIHKTPTKEGGETHSDTLLKFEIPLGYNPELAPVDQANLFMRVTPLTASGVKAPYFKIPEFPTEAPKLYSTTEEES